MAGASCAFLWAWTYGTKLPKELRLRQELPTHFGVQPGERRLQVSVGLEQVQRATPGVVLHYLPALGVNRLDKGVGVGVVESRQVATL